MKSHPHPLLCASAPVPARWHGISNVDGGRNWTFFEYLNGKLHLICDRRWGQPSANLKAFVFFTDIFQIPPTSITLSEDNDSLALQQPFHIILHQRWPLTSGNRRADYTLSYVYGPGHYYTYYTYIYRPCRRRPIWLLGWNADCRARRGKPEKWIKASYGKRQKQNGHKGASNGKSEIKNNPYNRQLKSERPNSKHCETSAYAHWTGWVCLAGAVSPCLAWRSLRIYYTSCKKFFTSCQGNRGNFAGFMIRSLKASILGTPCRPDLMG